MTALPRALLSGFLLWFIVFVAAFVMFPIRQSARPLFESIMPVVITVVTLVFGLAYLRRVTGGYIREGMLLGVLWLAINVLIDSPLMLLGGPMKMTFDQYVADIGITYLMIPAITVGLGTALAMRGAAGPASSD